MKVEWVKTSVKQRDQVAEYIRRQFGAKRKTAFLQEVRQITKMLKDYPNMGPLDDLFENRNIQYHSIVINGLSKMVYFVGDDTIYIVAFWDTRREPKKQAEQVK